METEYIEETTADVTETETVVKETSAESTESTDTSVSDANDDGSADVEDVSFDPVTEQSEETGSNVPSDTTGEEISYTQEEIEQIVSAVLANEEVEEIEVTEEVEEVPRTLFNTPLDEYTVSEGLLVCIFLLLLANLINSIFKGSHWFSKL